MIATRSSGSSRNAAKHSPIARLVAASIALAGGRSSRTSSTAPLRVTRSVGSTIVSRSQRPQHLARDDVPLNLARAIPDAVDARVAPHALQRELAHQSHAAEDLDCPVRDAGNHLGGEELGLRDLAVRM